MTKLFRVSAFLAAAQFCHVVFSHDVPVHRARSRCSFYEGDYAGEFRLILISLRPRLEISF